MTSSLKVRDFSLSTTLECGQFFRHWKKDGFYHVVVRDRYFRVRQEGGSLCYEGADEAFVRFFFSLDDDYDSILSSLRKHGRIGGAIDAARGLRLIRQDPWECLVSYLCSVNSSILKITRDVEEIARHCGNVIRREYGEAHGFPMPGGMCGERELRALALGFRAPYIAGVARTIRDGKLDLEELRKGKCAYDAAKKALMSLKGVGPKVADCVLLFSLGFGEAFPVDRWIRRIMMRWYPSLRNSSDERVGDFARERFGNLAGYAQEFMFVHARRAGIELEKFWE